jgi:hypothetical protein
MRNEADTLKQNSISLTNPSYPDPYGGLSPQAFISVAARPNVAVLDDSIENGFGDTVTAGVSQQLRTNLAIHVDGVYTNLRRLARTQNINQPRPAVEFTTLDAATAARLTTLTTAQLNAARPMATWGNINQLASNGWHDYRALYLRLDKRFSDGYQYIVSYTRDWTENNVGTISDYYHPELNTGPAGREHSLVASGSARLPYEITLGAVWTIRSALPFGAMSGVDLTGTGTISMVPGTSRNMGGHDSEGTAQLLEAVNAWRGVRGLAPIPESQIQSSDYNRFDVRVSRSFALRASQRVELMFQVLNVFGHDNLIGGTGGNFIDNSLSNGFGTYTVTAPRQEAEVGVTFSF